MLTNEEIERRRLFVTASDVAAIIGVDKFKTAHKVWAEKLNLVPHENADNFAIRFGNHNEQLVASEAALLLKTRGYEVSHAGEWRVHHDGILAATLDRVVMPINAPLECKTSQRDSCIWGEDWTDVVPVNYFVQVQAQMMCTGADIAFLAAYIAGRGGVSMYEINRSGELQDVISEKVNEFWENVISRTQPDEPDIEVIKHVKRKAGKSINLDPAVVREIDEYQNLGVSIQELEERRSKVKAVIINKLGDAEVGSISGLGKVTYKEQAGCTHQVTREPTRVFRFIKEKDKKVRT